MKHGKLYMITLLCFLLALLLIVRVAAEASSGVSLTFAEAGASHLDDAGLDFDGRV